MVCSAKIPNSSIHLEDMSAMFLKYNVLLRQIRVKRTANSSQPFEFCR